MYIITNCPVLIRDMYMYIPEISFHDVSNLIRDITNCIRDIVKLNSDMYIS